jgi:uncharacterized protein YndB with AHSA1/START domain
MTRLTFDIYIRATPEDIWRALTDPAITPRYRFGLSFDTDWRAGSPLTSHSPDGQGVVHESVPAKRLAYSWIEADKPEANDGHLSTVTFELTPVGEVTRLTTTHDNLAPHGAFLRIVQPGWPMILSALKSLLETGEPLTYAPLSLRQRSTSPAQMLAANIAASLIDCGG